MAKAKKAVKKIVKAKKVVTKKVVKKVAAKKPVKKKTATKPKLLGTTNSCPDFSPSLTLISSDGGQCIYQDSQGNKFIYSGPAN